MILSLVGGRGRSVEGEGNGKKKNLQRQLLGKCELIMTRSLVFWALKLVSNFLNSNFNAAEAWYDYIFLLTSLTKKCNGSFNATLLITYFHKQIVIVQSY